MLLRAAAILAAETAAEGARAAERGALMFGSKIVVFSLPHFHRTVWYNKKCCPEDHGLSRPSSLTQKSSNPTGLKLWHACFWICFLPWPSGKGFLLVTKVDLFPPLRKSNTLSLELFFFANTPT